MSDIESALVAELVSTREDRDHYRKLAETRLDMIDRLLMDASPRTLIGCHCLPGRPHDSLCVLKPVDEAGADTFLASRS